MKKVNISIQGSTQSTIDQAVVILYKAVNNAASFDELYSNVANIVTNNNFPEKYKQSLINYLSMLFGEVPQKADLNTASEKTLFFISMQIFVINLYIQEKES